MRIFDLCIKKEWMETDNRKNNTKNPWHNSHDLNISQLTRLPLQERSSEQEKHISVVVVVVFVVFPAGPGRYISWLILSAAICLSQIQHISQNKKKGLKSKWRDKSVGGFIVEDNCFSALVSLLTYNVFCILHCIFFLHMFNNFIRVIIAKKIKMQMY